ncbi:hypothetical protein XENOCAPTIV_006334 [Xenoophorus captivus]|uniref:Dynein attachment factor N-terminal domain-containing protein n=1 Tax=Xenoophorus captivus TaxID=1517983 RepID=A0ABV0QYU7_9TELE
MCWTHLHQVCLRFSLLLHGATDLIVHLLKIVLLEVSIGASSSSGVVMSQRDVIDFAALEKELQAAVESERRYQRENQAKLRAVSQGVGYDQFRWVLMKT